MTFLESPSAVGTFVAVGILGTILTSANGATWTSNTFPFNNPPAPTLYGVAFGNGSFVAVGHAVVLTSADGVTWASQPIDPTVELQSVAFGNGGFVAVGKDGLILSSLNGITWVTEISGTSQDLIVVNFGNGKFLRLRRIWARS